MQLETKNKIKSFDMIGWTDPDDIKNNKATRWLRSLSHDNYLYDQNTFNPKKPPNVIFVPEEAVLNKLIEAVAKHGDDTD